MRCPKAMVEPTNIVNAIEDFFTDAAKLTGKVASHAAT